MLKTEPVNLSQRLLETVKASIKRTSAKVHWQ
jgi:hypothetical protein